MKIDCMRNCLVLRMVLISVGLLVTGFPGLAKYSVSLDKVVSPHCMRVHSGRVYLLQDGTVFVYKCADGRFIREFGRSGEGPGETRRFPTRGNMLRVNDRGVFIDARNKVVWFDLEGRLIKEFKKPYAHFVVEPFRHGWVTLMREASVQGLDMVATRCASDFRVLGRYITYVSKKTGFSLFPDSINFVAAGDSFYIENSRKGFVVSQYNGDGILSRTLRLNPSPVSVSPEDVEFACHELAADPETRKFGGLENVKKMLGRSSGRPGGKPVPCTHRPDRQKPRGLPPGPAR